jgi:outer membrane protein OmpA-like peptidoglycan-associated protein
MNLAQANEAQAQRQAPVPKSSPEAQLAELAARRRGLAITLGDVLFGTDLARLNADGTRMAQRLSTILQQNPQRVVLVEGFADSTGQTQHNQELSERRAMAVRDALLDMGVARERISQRGYGESYPVAANDTAANRQLNRRVEIVLSDDRGVITPAYRRTCGLQYGTGVGSEHIGGCLLLERDWVANQAANSSGRYRVQDDKTRLSPGCNAPAARSNETGNTLTASR